MHQRGAAPFFSPCHRPRFASRCFASPTLALSPTHRQRACHPCRASGSPLAPSPDGRCRTSAHSIGDHRHHATPLCTMPRPSSTLPTCRDRTALGHEHLRFHHGRTRRAPLLSVASASCSTQCRSASAQPSFPPAGPDRLHPCHSPGLRRSRFGFHTPRTRGAGDNFLCHAPQQLRRSSLQYD